MDENTELSAQMFADSPEGFLSLALNEDTCVPAEESRTSEDVDVDAPSVSETQPTRPKIVSVRGSCPPVGTDAAASGVSVMTLVKKSEGGRVYNKKFYCLYCSKPQGKMARHLGRKHQREPEVERALAFPKGSRERRVRLRLLTNRGNHAHNIQVLREGRGLTIPLKQSTVPENASDYVHCFNCEGFLKRKFLRRHMQTCQERVRCEADGRAVRDALTAPPTRHLNSDFLKLLREMHQDQVTEAVCSDRYVLELGEELYLKHAHDTRKREYIRQRMRDAGRLLLQGWTTGKLQTITDFVLPTNFPSVIRAVQRVAGLDRKTNSYKTPSLLIKLRYILKKVALLVEREAANAGDLTTVKNMTAFRKMCNSQWVKHDGASQGVASLSVVSQGVAKAASLRAPQLCVYAEDVRTIHRHLNVQRKELQSMLGEEPSQERWEELAELTLCEVMLFNGRSDQHVSEMSLTALSRDDPEVDLDQDVTLSKRETILRKNFIRLQIRDGNAPVFVTAHMLASMKLLVTTRLRCGVPQENHFLFARPQDLGHLSGSDAIRHVAQTCGVKHGEAMASGKLRTHTAAIVEVLVLQDLDHLTELLGHEPHVSYQDATLQLAWLSKVLLALDAGRTLAQVRLQSRERVLEDSEASEEVKVSVPPSSPSPVRPGRRRWTEEEVEAVEETLMHCITRGKVPCKAQCVACIKNSPNALSSRTWLAVKFYVKNRIDMARRDSSRTKR